MKYYFMQNLINLNIDEEKPVSLLKNIPGAFLCLVHDHLLNLT